MTERKYCTSCQSERSVEGGSWVKSRVRRWLCGACTAHKNESIYASQATRQRWLKEGIKR